MKTLKDFNTLQDSQEYTIKEIYDADSLREYLMLAGKWGKVMSHTKDYDDPLFSAASGIVHKVNSRESISFDPLTESGSKHLIMLDGFVSMGHLSPEEKDHIISMASTAPLANTTLVQFNQAKGVYTEKEVIGFIQGKNIKITLIDALPENCIATTWDDDNGFESENFGKVAQLKAGVNMYKLKTDSKKADGNLFVRIPLENFNFTVELI